MYILYCSENFGNLFIFEFAGKGFFIMVWCPKLAFESAAKKSFFLISEENVPEKYSEWNLSVEEEAEKRLE